MSERQQVRLEASDLVKRLFMRCERLLEEDALPARYVISGASSIVPGPDFEICPGSLLLTASPTAFGWSS